MTELTTVLLTYFIMLGPQPGKQELTVATYKYSGMEQGLRTYAETYPKGLRLIVTQSFLIGTTVSKRYLQYGWEF